MKFNKQDMTLIVTHALLTGLYNDSINGLRVDDAEELDRFMDMGRRVGMASTAITEGLYEWLTEEPKTNDNNA